MVTKSLGQSMKSSTPKKSNLGRKIQRSKPVQDVTKTVLIVVRELYGAGGISDAGANLRGMAEAIAETGCPTTILWVPEYEQQQRMDVAVRDWHIEKLKKNFLIDLEILTDVPELSPHLSFPEKASLATYYWIKKQFFDEVYFAVEGGLSYYTLVAMELGLYSPPGPISVLVHSPLEWLAETEKRYLTSIPELALVHMERYAIEYAPNRIFFSKYMENWCVSKGWKLLGKSQFLFPLQPQELRVSSPRTKPAFGKSNEINLGFWPGWEFRSGAVALYDALDKVSAAGAKNFVLNCFGNFSQILGEHTGGMLIRRARNWPFKIRFFPKQTESQCLEYIGSRGGIVIAPHLASGGSKIILACLNAGIPLITTTNGSNAELISRAQKNALAGPKPVDLATSILGLCDKAIKVLVPEVDQAAAAENLHEMRSKLRQTGKQGATKTVGGKKNPLVSIIIAHYERPVMLADALFSVTQQDYQNIEVVLVDDGSKTPEAVKFLKELEPDFKSRGWKIIRQKNRYLGAARNTGIRASRGRYVLFFDDDNALLPHAVSTFVKALETSGSDICTSVSKIFVGAAPPSKESDGFVEYVPLGGSLNLAFTHDSFGDANAMIRREVFDKIGYLIEDYGFVASDWEFFTRAALNDLKIRIIPEATYWYRSSAEGMFRNAHWYETRKPILELFRKYNYKGLDQVHEMLMSQTTYIGERNSLGFRLRYDRDNAAMERLNLLDAQSSEAYQCLAEIASAEGRPDAALTLLAQIQGKPLLDQAWKTWLSPSIAQTSLLNAGLPPVEKTTLGVDQLRGFAVASTTPNMPTPPSYIRPPESLFIETCPSGEVVAVLAAGLPAGSISLSMGVSVDDQAGEQVEVMVSVIETEIPDVELKRLDDSEAKQIILGTSGWRTMDRRYMDQLVDVQFSKAASGPASIVISIKSARRVRHAARTLVCFKNLSFMAFRGLNAAHHPRLHLPSNQLRAQALSGDELSTVQLVTQYPGEFDLLKFEHGENGFLLRPSPSGPVVAVMQWAFPQFAKSLLASVEVADDVEGSFDFSVALARPSYLGDWTSDGPHKALAFSGWRRVTRKFEWQEIEVSLNEPQRYHLAICAAVRLPPGTSPDQARTFWRKFVVRW